VATDCFTDASGRMMSSLQARSMSQTLPLHHHISLSYTIHLPIHIATPPTLPPSTARSTFCALPPPAHRRASYHLAFHASPYIASTHHPSHIRHHVCRQGSHPVQEEGQPEPVSIPHSTPQPASRRCALSLCRHVCQRHLCLHGANIIPVTRAARSTTTMRSPPPSLRRRRSPTA
jgi:hypothetical protein